jgi:hypothetical protein
MPLIPANPTVNRYARPTRSIQFSAFNVSVVNFPLNLFNSPLSAFPLNSIQLLFSIRDIRCLPAVAGNPR